MRWFKKKQYKEKVEVRRTVKHVSKVSDTIDELIRREKYRQNKRRRGLVCEDNVAEGEVVTRVFDSLTDRAVDFVQTAESLESDIEKNNLAFILTDVNIPKESGIDVVYRCWKKGIVNCPVFFYSGMKLIDDELLKVKEMGATFFEKPYDISELKTIAESVLVEGK